MNPKIIFMYKIDQLWQYINIWIDSTSDENLEKFIKNVENLPGIHFSFLKEKVFSEKDSIRTFVFKLVTWVKDFVENSENLYYDTEFNSILDDTLLKLKSVVNISETFIPTKKFDSNLEN